MKKLILLLILIITISISNCIHAQSLKENEVDEFTGNSVKRTSWEVLNMNMKFTAYFRTSKINEIYYFDLKLMLGAGGGSVFSMSQGEELMFKLSTGEIIKLYNIEYAITCTGCGAIGLSGSSAQGISVSYTINTEDIQKLTTNVIEKYRIYTNDGYIENLMKPKFDDKLKKSFRLLN